MRNDIFLIIISSICCFEYLYQGGEAFLERIFCDGFQQNCQKQQNRTSVEHNRTLQQNVCKVLIFYENQVSSYSFKRLKYLYVLRDNNEMIYCIMYGLLISWGFKKWGVEHSCRRLLVSNFRLSVFIITHR